MKHGSCAYAACCRAARNFSVAPRSTISVSGAITTRGGAERSFDATASFVIVPFVAFRSLLNERDLNTFELLNITTLSPRKIVWGKLLSSLVQLFIYYSAIAPFIVFTYCLNGITIPTILFLLMFSLVISIEFALASLMVSTFARQRQTQIVLSLILLVALTTILITLLSRIHVAVCSDSPGDGPPA